MRLDPNPTAAEMEWRPDYLIFRRSMIDGTKAKGFVMRRRVIGGGWEYRKPDHAEIATIFA